MLIIANTLKLDLGQTVTTLTDTEALLLRDALIARYPLWIVPDQKFDPVPQPPTAERLTTSEGSILSDKGDYLARG